MKKLLVVVVLLIACTVYSAEDFDAYVYWTPSGTKEIITWDPVVGAEGYEIYIYVMETGQKLLTGRILATNFHEVTFKTKSRHYVYFCRAFWVRDGVKVFGEWSDSLDGTLALVGDRPRAWVIYVP